MRNCLKIERFLYILLLISLVGFLVLPKICLADELENITSEELSKYLELPEKDANRLMDTLRQVFTTEGIFSWSSAYTTEEEISVAVTLLKVVKMQALSHLLVDAPLEITQKIIKAAIDIVQIYINPAVFWEKFEKLTVEKAIEEGKKQLFQNEIRVTPGAIKFKYYSYKGGEKEIILQYVMIYKPERNNERAKVVIRFYMPNPIEAPAPEKYGSITRLSVPDLKKDIPPFIVEIKGIVKRDEFDNYLWINEGGEMSHPSVNITFPPTVPDLGIKPLSTWEKYVLKPIETTIKDIEVIITKVTGKSINLVEIWDKIKSTLSKLNPFGPAAVVEGPKTEEAEIEKEIEEVEETPVEVGQEVGQNVGTVEVKPQPTPPQKLTSEEIQKKLDDIAERIKILNQKVAELSEASLQKAASEKLTEEEEVKKEETKEETLLFLSKILISEVCAGLDKAENEFIELYNPNDTPVSLSDENFNLKLVNSSDEITKKKINWNKNVIPAKGYFLLVGGELKIDGQTLSPDATFSSQLTGTSGVIIADSQDNVLDKVAWGKPDKLPPSEAIETQGVILEQGLQTGKSLERIKQGDNLIDNNNNSQDFILSSSPSPTNSSGEKKVYSPPTSGGGGSYTGGGAPPPQLPSYPKILISEIQISPTGERFIELYNPNNETVILTGWYIQKKTETGTSWNSLVSSTKFEGKGIQSQSYFLIARSSTFNPDILLEDLTLTKNNVILLKNPNKEIVDKVGWGQAQDFETAPTLNPETGQSIGRKWSENSQNYIDTDNNSADFEIQIPTPKAKNQRDITPPEIEIISGPPSLTNQTQATFYFKVNEENCSFECELDNQGWQSCGSPIKYENLSDGQHTFSVRAIDLFLNESLLAECTWTIDTSIESPTISLFDLNTNSQFYTNQREAGVLAFVTSEEEGVSWFLSEENTTSTIDGTNWLSSKPERFTLSAGDSLKKVYIWTKDEAGNISQLENSASIILDTTPPTSQISELEPWQTSTIFAISWWGSDLTSGVADYTLQYTTGISDGIWLDLEKETEETEREFSGEDGIDYYFRVKAKDKAQNESSWSEIVSTTVDISPPEIISFNVPHSSDQLSFEISWSGIDPISAVTSSGIDGFQLRFSEDKENWIYYPSEDEYTLNTKYDFSGQDEKTYYFQIKARDEAGNESQWFEKSTKIEVPKDKTPPEVNFNSISETQNSIFFSLSWTAEDPIGNVTPSGIEIFSIQYSSTPPQDGLKYLESGKWKNWPSSMALELGANENEIKLEGKDGYQYSFSLKARDRAGNESQESKISTKISLPFPQLSVVINEIAWMGTKANSNDEWIELYNNTTSTVDITGWRLVSSDSSPNITFSTSSILANSYFLLERTDNTTVNDISADLIYTGALRNDPNCEILSLYDAQNNLIDETACLENGNWPAGKASPDYITMERIKPNTSGTDSTNWANNNLITRNGYDAGTPANKISGTPRLENSVSKSSTEISGEVNFPTLTYLGSPYIVKWELTIPQGKTLTIEPGVVIKFYDGYSGMAVQGTLKAIGGEADDKKIVFTSRIDNPQPGSWKQIYFSPTSVNSELINTIIKYGGSFPSYWPDCPYQMAAVRVDQSSIIFKNSIFERNRGKGLYLMDSPSIIDNVQFLWHQVGCGSGEAIALLMQGGSPEIKNSTFKNNTFGIYLMSGGSPVVDNNIFEENGTPIYVQNSHASFSNNQTPNNTNNINGILIFDSNINQDTIWQVDLPYIIDGNLIISQDVVFILNPGVIIKFKDGYSGIIVNGTLKAIGGETDDKRIVFTSYGDDEYGGSGNPAPGDWKQIYLSPTSVDSELINVIVSYGGSFPSYWPDCPYQMAAIRVDQSSITLKDSIVEQNKGKGLYLINSSSTIDNVKFLEHRVGCGSSPAIALLIDGDSPTIKNSTFKDNYYGIYIQSGEPVFQNLNFENNNTDVYSHP